MTTPFEQQRVEAIRQALDDALCVIDGDAPEDISREEAEDDTRSLIRCALNDHLPALTALLAEMAEALERHLRSREGICHLPEDAHQCLTCKDRALLARYRSGK